MLRRSSQCESTFQKPSFTVIFSKGGHVYLVEEDDVWLLSSDGKMMNKVVMNARGARAVTEMNGTLCVSIDGKGVIFYKIMDLKC